MGYNRIDEITMATYEEGMRRLKNSPLSRFLKMQQIQDDRESPESQLPRKPLQLEKNADNQARNTESPPTSRAG